mmetsp:Transcript_102193/g.286467  ORF Transcript_102193/g.286467 Transcript_102193/m.286467 type:complete len:222 (-) Transcript_102193:10-675(-)
MRPRLLRAERRHAKAPRSSPPDPASQASQRRRKAVSLAAERSNAKTFSCRRGRTSASASLVGNCCNNSRCFLSKCVGRLSWETWQNSHSLPLVQLPDSKYRQGRLQRSGWPMLPSLTGACALHNSAKRWQDAGSTFFGDGNAPPNVHVHGSCCPRNMGHGSSLRSSGLAHPMYQAWGGDGSRSLDPEARAGAGSVAEAGGIAPGESHLRKGDTASARAFCS